METISNLFSRWFVFVWNCRVPATIHNGRPISSDDSDSKSGQYSSIHMNALMNATHQRFDPDTPRLFTNSL